MVVMMSNVYVVGENYETEQLLTGFVGAFENRETFKNVWNDTLKKFGVPEDKFEEYQPRSEIGNTFVPLGNDEKFIEDVDNLEFVVELMSKETEMNKVWTPDE
jgi:hypothetical protein